MTRQVRKFIGSDLFRVAEFVFVLLLTVHLTACSHLPGMTRLPESSLHETLPQNPERNGDLARILEGQYLLRTMRRDEGLCGRSVQVLFHLGRVEWIEPVFAANGCRQLGELHYQGSTEIGEITAEDALSRRMLIRMESVNYQAREVAQFGPYTQVDSCRLSQLVGGQVFEVTGKNCGWLGSFPERNQVVSTRIRMNSGQTIQIQDLPLVTKSGRSEPSPRRDPASTTVSAEGLSFDRVSL